MDAVLIVMLAAIGAFLVIALFTGWLCARHGGPANTTVTHEDGRTTTSYAGPANGAVALLAVVGIAFCVYQVTQIGLERAPPTSSAEKPGPIGLISFAVAQESSSELGPASDGYPMSGWTFLGPEPDQTTWNYKQLNEQSGDVYKATDQVFLRKDALRGFEGTAIGRWIGQEAPPILDVIKPGECVRILKSEEIGWNRQWGQVERITCPE